MAVYAATITSTFQTPSAPLAVIYNFPTITMTSLTAGETVVDVFFSKHIILIISGNTLRTIQL